MNDTAIKFCPLCGQNLRTTSINGRNRLVCFACEFVHWDNPLPVTATIIPYIGASSASVPSLRDVMPPSSVRSLDANINSLNLPSKNNKIVLVRRKYLPFIDDWCLPGGFIEAQESPQDSAIREVQEETGLTVEIERIVDAYAPGKGINVIIIFYLAKPAKDDLLAGDDASEVACFSQAELPKNIAFPLHKQIIDKWFADKL